MHITSLFPRTRAAAPGGAPSATSTAAIDDVGSLNQQYIGAVLANDDAWFRRHLAEEAVLVLGDGRRLGKAQFLDTLSSEPRTFRSLTFRDVTLRAFGTMVQVDADAPWELHDGSVGVSHYMDTWAWLEGRWQVISAQITPLSRPSGAPRSGPA